MDSTGILVFLGILVCLALLALVSAAFGSLERLQGDRTERVERLRRYGSWAAAQVLRQLDDRPRIWATVSIVRTAALVGVAALSVALTLRLAPGSAWAALPALVVGALLSLAAQAWGHAFAVHDPERTALSTSLPFSALLWAGYPLARALLSASRSLAQESKAKKNQDENATPEDVARAIESRQKADYEQRMIRAILRLEETSVREIMVPRPDIVAISSKASVRQAVDLVIAEGYSRIPVYQDTLDNIVGVLHAKDLLPHISGQPAPKELHQLARRPYFVPETKRADELLREMQDKRVQLAIVVDEYGGTSGLVTIEDVVEEIVGDIEDEFDVAEQKVVRISATEAIMDAQVSVDELGAMFGVEVQGEGFDTIGGYVYHLLGKVPVNGDRVETEQLRIDVLSTLGRRVKRVRVTRLTPEAQREQTQAAP